MTTEGKTFAKHLEDIFKGNAEITAARWRSAFDQTIAGNAKLGECDSRQLMDCGLQIAQLGLFPKTGAAILCFGKNPVPVVHITFDGLMSLVQRTPGLTMLPPKLIRKGEEFQLINRTTGGKHMTEYHHSPSLTGEGDIIGVVVPYSIDDIADVYYVPVSEILKVRDSLRNGQGAGTKTPWHTHFERKCETTAALRLGRRLPLNPLATSLMGTGISDDDIDHNEPTTQAITHEQSGQRGQFDNAPGHAPATVQLQQPAPAPTPHPVPAPPQQLPPQPPRQAPPPPPQPTAPQPAPAPRLQPAVQQEWQHWPEQPPVPAPAAPQPNQGPQLQQWDTQEEL